ncbi:hypothetical protein [Pedobacter miscanthi]|uniref:hypothetical protein n=1 Tax=Pedobacter miscanthi TaxID=2259170 RepID=UPI002931829A|nr:hypothetical protein [Pedobacter miscanthi]
MKKNNLRINVFLILISVSVVGLCSALMLSNDVINKNLPSETVAYSKSKELVSAHFKSAKTEFPGFCSAKINSSDSTYILTTYVDVANGVTPPVRIDWAIKLKYQRDKNWSVVKLVIKQ